MITPIYNEPSCSEAACHAHPASRSVLGVLDVALDARRVDEQIRAIEVRTALFTVPRHRPDRRLRRRSSPAGSSTSRSAS